MQPHVAVFLNVFSFSFLSANEGISSYECFKYPWKFVGGSAWNTSLLRSAGIDPLQITFRVFVNIDSCCPLSSLQSFHSDMSSLLRECLHWKSLLWEALGNLWEHENMGINQCIWTITYFKDSANRMGRGMEVARSCKKTIPINSNLLLTLSTLRDTSSLFYYCTSWKVSRKNLPFPA